MVTDEIAIIAWIIMCCKTSSQIPGRAALAVGAIFGFISTIFSILTVGHFAQIVDVANDPLISLGWPPYLLIFVSLLALFTTILAVWSLYLGRRRVDKDIELEKEAQMALIARGIPHELFWNAPNVIQNYRHRLHSFLTYTPRTLSRIDSCENLVSDDEERQQETTNERVVEVKANGHKNKYQHRAKDFKRGYSSPS